MSDKVSVVLPVYNRKEKVKRSVNSVLEQTYNNLEVIVVDDGSKYKTYKVLCHLINERVKVIRLEQNRGVSKARNVGIKNSKGKFVAFIDSDDRWKKDKIEKQVKYINGSSKDIAVTDCDWEAIDENNGKYKVEKKCGPTSRRKLLSFQNVCSPPTVVARRSVLEEMGGFDERLQTAEDVDLWVRISKKYDFGHVPEVLVEVQRGHKKRLGKRYQRFIIGHLKFYSKHKKKYEKIRNKDHAHFFIRVARRLLSMRKIEMARRFLAKAILLNPYNIRSYMLMVSTAFGKSVFSRLSRIRKFVKNNLDILER